MLHLLRKKTCKQIVHLVIILILFSHISNAQVLNLEDHDNKPYYFGITLGVNLARFQTDLHPRFLQYDTVLVAEPGNAGGFAMGLSATGRLSNRFELRFNPQLMFTERHLTYKLKYPDPGLGTNVTKKIESVIISFPLQLKFNSDRIGNFRVYMLG